MPYPTEDTITAIATAPGAGAIAIIRISGPATLSILERLFSPSRQSSSTVFSFIPRHMHYGYARDLSGAVLDEVLAVYMPGPHSSTGEDVGELHCHGGQSIQSLVLETIISAGARLAVAGEFTRRAYLNGRLDLTQAEAIAEIISANGREGIRLAAAKLEGQFGRLVNRVKASVDGLRMRIILAVDFPDEEALLDFVPEFKTVLGETRKEITDLLLSFERASLWREGATVVLAGKVNTGKSSLLNALLGRPRAIVSAEAGTTRDYIEESIVFNGIAIRVIDTAGLRTDSGTIESEGISRSRSLASEADLILYVLEKGQTLSADELLFAGELESKIDKGQVIVLFNKCDIADSAAAAGQSPSDLPTEYRPANFPRGTLGKCPCFAVSAKTGSGLGELGKAIVKNLMSGCGLDPDSGIEGQQSDLVPNLRQSHLLKAAEVELAALEPALKSGYPPEILSVHLEAASKNLEQVVGASANEELLNQIFSNFCLGK